jgi:CRISPR/Cas system CMR-associated protein Cmr1 (group 7 of RAMP superfamily)
MIVLLTRVYDKLETMQQIATIKQDQTAREVVEMKNKMELQIVYINKLTKKVKE